MRHESNSELLDGIRRLVTEERQITRHILERIHEVDIRELYLDQGYNSLLDWLTRDLGYSHSAAYRRVQAARQLGAVPEIASKIDSGALNLTTLSALQTAVHKEEKRTQTPLSVEQRSHLLDRIVAKSASQARQAIAEEFPEQAVNRDRVGASNDQIRLTTYFSRLEHDDLQKARAITHPSPGSVPWSSVIVSWARNIVRNDERARFENPVDSTQSAAAEKIEAPIMEPRVAAAKSNLDDSVANALRQAAALGTINATKTVIQEDPHPALTNPRASASKSNIFTQAVTNESSFRAQSKADLYRAVRERDSHSCTYQDPFTGRICGSTYQVQIDHRIPKALGGLDTFENLRLLCRNHSAMMAKRLVDTDDGSDDTSNNSGDPLLHES